VLMILHKNSKLSNREISSKLGIAKETVASKINYFLKEEIIKDFSLGVNYSYFGFKEANVFFRLKTFKKSNLDDLVKYLSNHYQTTWIGKCFGKYDLKVSILLNEFSNINEFISQVTLEFGDILDAIDYIFVVDKYKASADIFIKNLFGLENLNLFNEKFDNDDKRYNLNKVKNNVNKLKNSLNDIDSINKNDLKKIKKIDLIDRKIIYELGQNPRIPYVELSNKLHENPRNIINRIKKLEKDEIILKRSIVFNGAKFGKVWCELLLTLNPAGINKFKIFLRKYEFLSTYVECVGKWNFWVKFFTNDLNELYSKLNMIREEFAEDIITFDFLIFFEIYKYPKIPKIILMENQ
ncbi:MAG: Lrp/AsnC family transcriptional regulator, partial [Nanoarchaeota archaeon]|nr:Lrp/AsnC family transcriptional regulator [Nanoarchaeota archaeon]